MKTKNINSADFNHASELSDDALLNISGGSSEYANAVEALIHAGPGSSSNSSHDPINRPHSHSTDTHASAGSHDPINQPHSHSINTSTHASQGQTTHGVPGEANTAGHSSTGSSTSHGPTGASTHGGGGAGFGSDIHDVNNDGHEGIHNALEAAHDRFHQQLDHVGDGLDSITHGAGQIAGAMVEVSPIVAGVHFLNDIHKKTSSKTTKP